MLGKDYSAPAPTDKEPSTAESPPNHAEMPKKRANPGTQAPTLDEINQALRGNPLQHLQTFSPRLEKLNGMVSAWDTDEREYYNKPTKFLVLTFDGEGFSSEPDWYDSGDPYIEIRYSSHHTSGFVAFIKSAADALGYSAAEFNLDLLVGETLTMERVDHSWDASGSLRPNHSDGRFHAKVWKVAKEGHL